MINYDATGIQIEDKQYTKKLLPKGYYNFEIIEFISKSGITYPCEGITKNGDPKVDLLVEVTTPGEFEGERIFHSIAFLPKDKPGAGMALHWLKTIGQNFEGSISIDPSAWVGAEFQGYVIQDEYKGRIKNKISEIKAMGDKPASTLPLTEEGVPF